MCMGGVCCVCVVWCGMYVYGVVSVCVWVVCDVRVFLWVVCVWCGVVCICVVCDELYI